MVIAIVRGLGVIALATLACSPSSETVFACLVGSGTSQVCVETTTDIAADVNCGSGTQLDACPRDGADGGCRQTVQSSDASLNQTTWYYSGAPVQISQEMVACTNTGGTWIAP